MTTLVCCHGYYKQHMAGTGRVYRRSIVFLRSGLVLNQCKPWNCFYLSKYGICLHDYPGVLPWILQAAHGWDWACLPEIYCLLKEWSSLKPMQALELGWDWACLPEILRSGLVLNQCKPWNFFYLSKYGNCLHDYPGLLPWILQAAHGWDWACLPEIYCLLKEWSSLKPMQALELLLPQ